MTPVVPLLNYKLQDTMIVSGVYMPAGITKAKVGRSNRGIIKNFPRVGRNTTNQREYTFIK